MQKLGLFLICLILLVPYNVIGQELGSSILLSVGSIVVLYLLHNQKKFDSCIEMDYKFILSCAALLLTAIASIAFSNNYTLTGGGISLYANLIVYYIIFSKLKPFRDRIMQAFVLLTAAASVVFIIYQGIILQKRIDGMVGYANTYALLLLIAVCFIEILEFNNAIKYALATVLFLALIYTGSRNTFIYLLIAVVIISILQLRKKQLLLYILSSFNAILIYVLIYKFGFGMLLVMPFIIYPAYLIFNKVPNKYKNIAIVAMCIIVGGVLALTNTDFATRLGNFSIRNGTLQERLVYYQDAINHILKHPFGTGINTYEYRQYSDQSAFYDVRFIHNSILQVCYDMGVQGTFLFILQAVIGLIAIIRSKACKGKVVAVFTYVIIYAHSMLDFDFSYPFVFIILSMLIAFYQEPFMKNKEERKKSSLIYKLSVCGIVLLLISNFYIFILDTNYFIGDKLFADGKYMTALKFYDINKKISIKDPDAYSKCGNVYNALYNGHQDRAYLNRCLENYKIGEEINSDDPRIIGNMAFIYEKLGNQDKTISYYNKFLYREKFYQQIYNVYYDYLKKQYKLSKDEKIKKEMLKLQDTFNMNKAKLNNKSIYMKNQLEDSIQ